MHSFFTAMFFIKVIKMTVKGDAGHSSLHIIKHLIIQFFHTTVHSTLPLEKVS